MPTPPAQSAAPKAVVPTATQAIRYLPGLDASACARTEVCTLRMGTPLDLEESIGETRPAILAVERDAVTALRAATLKDGVKDLGEKIEDQELMRYLKRVPPERIGLLVAPYTCAGRALQGLRAGLCSAQAAKHKRALVVALEPDVFLSLREMADREADPGIVPSARRRMDPGLERAFPGSAAASRWVRDLVMRATEHDRPVLLRGGPGTGKCVVAREIHRLGKGRGKRPFVVVDCAAVCDSPLLVRELRARWREAGRGTLYLAHVESMPRALQAEVYRLLGQTHLGSTAAAARFPGRLIAGSTTDLYARVARGKFDEGLFFRLRTFPIELPPLRARADGIRSLADLFWKDLAGKRARLPAAAVRMLGTYPWPGNVRELKAVLQRLFFTFGQHLRDEQVTFVLRDGQMGDDTQHLESREHALHALEAVHGVLSAFSPVQTPEALASEDLQALKAQAVRDRAGIALLLRQPLRFRHELLYALMVELEQHLAYLEQRLDKDPQEAKLLWRQEMAPLAKRLLRLLHREVRRLPVAIPA